ncbi:MAG: NAD(P)-binding protein [Marinomonas sp.]
MAENETDYLIIGAGAVGLAFADTLIDEDPDCSITFVDKHAKPGGHWNDAYSFVALHQPSAIYGVNSLDFESEQIDTHGPNAGYHALASGPEISAYFEKVMNMRLLPTGRVTYHRLAEYRGKDEATGEAKIVSILGGEETRITVRRRIVDATFYQTSVPSTHTRAFEVDEGTQIIVPGELPDIWKRGSDLPPHYVIIGAGKTAMDTAVWLLEGGVKPANISWVRPRESWLINRKTVQPGEEFFEDLIGTQIAHLKAAAVAQDGAEMMRILGESGHYLRIDPDIEPEMFHFAVISEGEIERMREVKNVLRAGHVQSITDGTITFANGTKETVPRDSLFIDCTARAVPFSFIDRQKPLFEDGLITLQPLHVPLVTFSAAVTAFIEVHFPDDAARNALAIPGPLTDNPQTYPHAFATTMMNRGNWSQDPKIAAWLVKSRLDPTGLTMAKMAAEGNPKLAILGEFAQTAAGVQKNLRKLALKAKQIHENT